MTDVKKDKWLVALVWIAGIIALWEGGAWLLSSVLHDPMATRKLPYLHDILLTFIKNWQSLLESGLETLSKSALGFLYGALIGAALAILMSMSKNLERVAFPYLIISQMIPILGLAPIIYNIVRSADTARIVIAAYITFFPVSINMLSGLKSVEKDRKDMMFSYAARKHSVYTKLMLPSALPSLFSGLKIAAPLSVTAAILVEMLGTDKGIGVKILYTLYYGAGSATVFWASVITSALLGVFGYGVVLLLERICIPWHRATLKRVGDAE